MGLRARKAFELAQIPHIKEGCYLGVGGGGGVGVVAVCTQHAENPTCNHYEKDSAKWRREEPKKEL